VSPDSAFNTAVSFVANTNWQGYAGESTMSYLTQMLGLTVQNFLSAATGIAVAFALVRGFARRGDGAKGADGKGLVGNFWADITRITLWVLLPMSFVLAMVFAGQGVIQNFDAYKTVNTLETTAFQQPKNGPDGQPLKDDKGQPVMEDATTARRRRSPWARSLRRRPSRCWAPTAAASSTPTRRTRTRTRPRW
jgi:K+-transporting ATPase ATPase A chain